MTVAEAALLRRQLRHLSVRLQHPHGADDLTELAAVGPGVHAHSTAKAPGDALSELKAGKAVAGGLVGQ